MSSCLEFFFKIDGNISEINLFLMVWLRYCWIDLIIDFYIVESWKCKNDLMLMYWNFRYVYKWN